MRVFLLVTIIVFALVACKKPAPGSGGSRSALIDAPAPTLPEGWAVQDHGVGFTLAVPQGWQVTAAPREVIETYVSARNENAWTVMEQTKADVNFDTVKGMSGLQSETGSAFELKSADRMFFALREEIPGINLEDAVARWRDTIFGGSSKPPIKEAEVDLPVGKAKTLTMKSKTLGFEDRTVVYFLVDGGVQYTVFFEESVLGIEPMSDLEVMRTFRVQR